MKMLLALLAIAVLGFALRGHPPWSASTPGSSTAAPAGVPDHVQDTAPHEIAGTGVVIRILRDDDSGDRHQRFLLRTPSGQTLLVAHNIDIAPRVEPLREGDTVAFKGEYVWNPKGGVVHWTHRDPAGRHPSG